MRRLGYFNLITGILSVGICISANQWASADDIAPAVEESDTENSVVVAKRQVEDPAPEEDDSESLQPISTVAEKEPQLADPDDHFMPEEVSEPVKMASNSVPVESTEANSETEAEEPTNSESRPALFRGIRPGESTKEQVIEAWGSPDEVAPTETGQLLLFQLESFRGVEVLVEDGLVTLMKINLQRPLSPSELAEKIAADTSEAVALDDPENDRVAAYAYPERGIVMVVDEPDDITPVTTELISQLLLQPLDADAFSLRASNGPRGEMTSRIDDLKQAATLAPHDASIHWQLSQAYSQAGLATLAEASAKRSLELEPKNMVFRQQWAETLAEVGKFDNAVITTREVLDAEDNPPIVSARAFHQMGLLASLGEAGIAKKAIQFHNMAIAEADKLAGSSDRQERIEAKRLLVEAHLAVAVELSKQDFEDNMKNVAEWVTRASELAEAMIADDGEDLGLRILVAERSLAALANFKPSNDPEPLINEIEETLKTIKEDSEDPLWHKQLDWIAGLAYEHAVEIEHHRRRPKQALEYSQKAIELMADQAEGRRDSPQTTRQVGKLFFHTGAVHAVHHTQHGEAVTWYEKAIPLMTTEIPESELLVPRHEGEALVSMAVSFWNEDQQDRAIELTEQGADLIEQAVNSGVMDKKTLAVPYGNLAAMHKKQGNMVESQRYAKLVETLKTRTAKQDVANAQEAEPQQRTTQQRTTQQRTTQQTRKPQGTQARRRNQRTSPSRLIK